MGGGLPALTMDKGAASICQLAQRRQL